MDLDQLQPGQIISPEEMQGFLAQEQSVPGVLQPGQVISAEEMQRLLMEDSTPKAPSAQMGIGSVLGSALYGIPNALGMNEPSPEELRKFGTPEAFKQRLKESTSKELGAIAGEGIKGTIDVGSLVPDALVRLKNLITGGTHPWGTTGEQLKKGLGLDEWTEPETTPGYLAGKVAKYAPGSVGPGGLKILGATVGGAITGEAIGGKQGEAVGALLGALTPAGITGVKALANKLGITEQGAKAIIGKELQAQGVSLDDLKVKDTSPLAPYKNTAELVKDPELKANLAARQLAVEGGEFSDIAAGNKAVRTAVRTNLLSEADPGLVPSGEAFTEGVKARVSGELQGAEARYKTLEDATLGPLMDQEDIGKGMRSAIQAKKDVAYQKAQDLYTAAGTVDVPTKKLKGILTKMAADFDAVRYPDQAAEIDTFKKTLDDLGPTADYQYLDDRLEEVRRLKDRGSRPARRYYQKLYNALEDTLKPVENAKTRPALQAFKEAKANYREYGEVFKDYDVGKVTVTDIFGRDKVTASSVANSVLDTGESAKQYLKAVEGDPQAVNWMKAFIRQKISNQGVISVQKAKSFLQNNKNLLEAIPGGFKQQFTQLINNKDELTAFLKQKQEVFVDILNPNLKADAISGRILGYPRQKLETLLQNLTPEEATSLSKTMYNKVVDEISSSASGQLKDGVRSLDYLLENTDNLERVIGPQKFAPIRQVIDDLKSELTAKELAIPTQNSATAQKLARGTTVNRAIGYNPDKLKAQIRYGGLAALGSGYIPMLSHLHALGPIVGGVIAARAGIKLAAYPKILKAYKQALISPQSAEAAMRLASRAPAAAARDIQQVRQLAGQGLVAGRMGMVNQKPRPYQNQGAPMAKTIQPKAPTPTVAAPIETPKPVPTPKEVEPLIKKQPPLIQAMIKVESNGNPTAVSKAGAIGLMQLMPGTAKELGVDPRDPEQNIKGGSAYIVKLQKKYRDDRVALVAYNWGPGNMDKLIARIRKMGKQPTWQNIHPLIPSSEAKSYSQKVMAALAKINEGMA